LDCYSRELRQLQAGNKRQHQQEGLGGEILEGLTTANSVITAQSPVKLLTISLLDRMDSNFAWLGKHPRFLLGNLWVSKVNPILSQRRFACAIADPID
jgi:hypothetical protein